MVSFDPTDKEGNERRRLNDDLRALLYKILQGGNVEQMRKVANFLRPIALDAVEAEHTTEIERFRQMGKP